MIFSRWIVFILISLTLPSSAVLFLWYFDAQSNPVYFVFAPIFVTSSSLMVVLVTIIVVPLAIITYQNPKPKTLAMLAFILLILGILHFVFAVEFSSLLWNKADKDIGVSLHAFNLIIDLDFERERFD